MKSDRRHELQTNTLADWLGKFIETYKPYARIVVGLIGLLLLVAGGLSYQANRSSAKQAEGWQDFYEAMEGQRESVLKELATRYTTTEVGLRATYSLANITYNEGLNKMYTDRDHAFDLLEDARDNFKTVVMATTQKQGFLKRQAMFGWAQTLEATNDSQNAKKQYEALATNWPETALGKNAADSANRMERQGSFFDWFFVQKPKNSMNLLENNSLEFGESFETNSSEADTSFLEGTDDPTSEPNGPHATSPGEVDLELDIDSSASDEDLNTEVTPDDISTEVTPDDISTEDGQ